MFPFITSISSSVRAHYVGCDPQLTFRQQIPKCYHLLQSIASNSVSALLQRSLIFRCNSLPFRFDWQGMCPVVSLRELWSCFWQALVTILTAHTGQDRHGAWTDKHWLVPLRIYTGSVLVSYGDASGEKLHHLKRPKPSSEVVEEWSYYLTWVDRVLNTCLAHLNIECNR